MAHTLAGLTMALAHVLLAVGLVCAAARDLEGRVIPNRCVAVVAAAAILRALARRLAGTAPLAAWGRMVAGGALVLAVMLAAAALFQRTRSEAGIGGGDVKLLAALGLWLGPAGGLACVALSCLVGLAGWAMVRGWWALAGARSSRQTKVAGTKVAGDAGLPMGPAIALTALALVLVGA